VPASVNTTIGGELAVTTEGDDGRQQRHAEHHANQPGGQFVAAHKGFGLILLGNQCGVQIAQPAINSDDGNALRILVPSYAGLAGRSACARHRGRYNG